MESSKGSPSWGKTVEMLRRIREWRQEVLAETAGVSLSALSVYETEKREPPDDARAAIERALGVAGWMEEAQALLGYLRRAMERPVDLGGALEKEAAERAAQVEILLRAGVARLLGSGDSDHDPQNASHAQENSKNGRRGSPHGLKNSGNGVRNSAHAPRNSPHAPKNSAHGS